MEGWQQDWWKMFETVVRDVEQFFEQVGQDINDAADAWSEFSEDLAEEIDAVITPGLDELDRHIEQWVDPLVQVIFGFESTLDRAIAPVSRTVEPMLNEHPICVGCRHYHGQAYNGVMFICAMHPYGTDEGVETCPDKEQATWSLPDRWMDSGGDE